MRNRCGAILSLLMTLVCPAAEIVAWKVPLSRYAHRGLESAGIIRCGVKPEASPFFKEGDELWDLKGVAAEDRIEHAPQVEWLVWNASSGRLVTKAGWVSVWQLHQRLGIKELPRQCRLTASVFDVAPDGAPPSKEKTARTTLTWVSRSGVIFNAAQRTGIGGMEVNGSVALGDSDSTADLQLQVSCFPREQPKMNFNCSVCLSSGTSLWLARDFDGKTGLDFLISNRIELVDGTPVDEAMMIQKGNQAEPVIPDRRQASRHRIGDDGWLVIQWLDPSELHSWGGANNLNEDPFAEKQPDQIRESLKLEEVTAPEKIQSWFNGPVWNVAELIRQSGAILTESKAFAGYDPRSRCVFLFTNDIVEADRFESLFSMGCIRFPKHVEVSVKGRGQTRLITRSGQKSSLSRTEDGKDPIRFLEIEPTIGEMAGLLDLRFNYRNGTGKPPLETIQSAVTLMSGDSINVLETSSDRVAASPLRLKAEIKELAR